MSLALIETWLQWAGAAALAFFLILVFVGMARALRRPRGRATGLGNKALRGPVYLLIGVPFFAVAYLLWRPLPVALSPPLHALALALGALLYFPGLSLALWGRLALGVMYNVSMSVGVQLHAGHRLITGGPYALVRHPMYLAFAIMFGITPLALGSWWGLIPALLFPLALALRIGDEEQLLCRELSGYEAYRRRVRYRLIPFVW